MRIDGSVLRLSAATIRKVAAALIALWCASPAQAGDACTPRLLASFDMTPAHGGGYAIPVGINGQPYKFIVQTSQPYSFVFDTFVSAADLRKLPVNPDMVINMGGETVTDYVHVDELALGINKGTHVSMLVTHGIGHGDTDVAGIIGTDLLENFDVEIDYKARKLNLFAANPCDGRGVYWDTHYAQLPITRDHQGQMTVPMTLDGKPVSVMFNSIAGGSTMESNIAKARFGLAPPPVPHQAPPPGRDEERHQADRPDSSQTPADSSDDGQTQAATRLANGSEHRFNSLDGDGLSISKPLVRFFGDPDAPPCDGTRRNISHSIYTGIVDEICYPSADLSLGLPAMEQLHLYFAYKAGKLYFTAASAP